MWNHQKAEGFFRDVLRDEFTVYCIGVLVVVFAICTLNKKSHRNSLPLPPGPIGFPIFGNGPQLGPKAHVTLANWSKKYGSVFRIHLGQKPVVVLNSLKAVREALVMKKRVFSGRPRFSSFECVAHGVGVVFNDSVSQPDVWQQRKKVMSSAIHEFALRPDTKQSMLKYLYEEIDYMVEEIEKQCQIGNGYSDPEDVIRLSISNAVCAIYFGQRYRADDKEFRKLLHHNKQFGRVVAAGSIVDVMPWVKIFPYFKDRMKDFVDLNIHMSEWTLQRVKEHIKTFDIAHSRDILDVFVKFALTGKADCLLREKSKNGNKNGDASATTTGANQNKPADSVDQLVLSALTVDIFGAAQDTLGSVLLYMFHYLIKYPDVQSKIREEIIRVTGKERPNESHLSNMPFLVATYHEMLRHSSALSMTIPHAATDDSSIAGYRVPKGTVIFINQYAINHDDEVWENPQEFNPYRFITTHDDGSIEVNVEQTKQYLIFSTGSRICPGQQLSNSWLTICMADLLKRCELFPNPERPPNDKQLVGLTTKPHELTLKLIRFNNQP